MAIKYDEQQDISQIRSEIHNYQWQFDKSDDEIETYKWTLRRYNEAINQLNQQEETFNA